MDNICRVYALSNCVEENWNAHNVYQTTEPHAKRMEKLKKVLILNTFNPDGVPKDDEEDRPGRPEIPAKPKKKRSGFLRKNVVEQAVKE